MKFVCESENIGDYLNELNEVNYTNPLITVKNEELFNSTQNEIEKTKVAFQFVRDEIAHSWDIQSTRVTCNASDVLANKEGICYAKANLLAALLRSQGIPTGFCYQRLMLFDTPEKGYCIHALNAVFLSSFNKWVRLDARGNNVGINAQFLIDEEKLAFMTKAEFDEFDYPTIYVNPHPKTIAMLKAHTNALEMYKYHLPEYL